MNEQQHGMKVWFPTKKERRHEIACIDKERSIERFQERVQNVYLVFDPSRNPCFKKRKKQNSKNWTLTNLHQDSPPEIASIASVFRLRTKWCSTGERLGWVTFQKHVTPLNFAGNSFKKTTTEKNTWFHQSQLQLEKNSHAHSARNQNPPKRKTKNIPPMPQYSNEPPRRIWPRS